MIANAPGNASLLTNVAEMASRDASLRKVFLGLRNERCYL
jgi:hypothetical protein